MGPKKLSVVLYIIFALSGFSGLIYESIWSHYLKLFLGHAAYSQILVLGIFMGGMGFGAWYTAKLVSRLKNLLLVYAIVEGMIGLCGLGFHSAFVALQSVSYNTVFPLLDSSTAVQIYKWLAGALIILPQSILLGSTFPLMSNSLIRIFSSKAGYSLSMLYFTNSIGASIGVLVSGFYLIAKTGLPGTLLTAGIINISLAVAVYMLAKPRSFTPPPVTHRTRKYTRPALMLIAAFVTGAASFIYEIAWLRMLSMVLGASTHAFELMLSAFIFGLAVGSLWIRKKIDNIHNPLRLAGIIQVCMGIFALLTIPLYNYTFNLMAFFMEALDSTGPGYILFNITSHFIALLIMLPTTICAGMTFPLFTSILLKQGHGEQSVGQIYASNTFGAIFGVAFIVLIGMPVFNLKGSMIIGSGLDILLGLVLTRLAVSKSDYSSKQILPAMAFLTALAAIISLVNLDTGKMTSGVFRHGVALLKDIDILYYKDGRTASISITKTKGQVLAIKTNGKSDAGVYMGDAAGVTSDEYTMTLLGALPVTYHPAAKTVAAIGMGSGLTSHTLLAWPDFIKVDTIEIEPAVVEAAWFFRPRVENVFTDPRSNVYIEDAKSFFSTHKTKYDIIISEPSNPWVSGISSLFTEEFYSVIKNQMNPDGLFVQWINAYEIDNTLLLSVLKALSLQFSDYKIYAPNQVDLVVLARNVGKIGLPDEVIFRKGAIANELNLIGIHNMQDLNVRFLGDRRLFGPYVDSDNNPVNSDYFPVLDYLSSRTRYMKMRATAIYEPREFHLPVLQIFYPWLEGNHTEDKLHTRFLPTERSMNRARNISRYIGGSSTRISDRVSQYHAEYLLDWSRTCGKQINEPLWVESIFNIMLQTLPYLHPVENLKIYKAITPYCQENISSAQVHWLNLFIALSDRGKEGIIVAAENMLDGDINLSPSQKRYIFSALFMSLIAAGEYDRALEIWEKYDGYAMGKTVSMPLTLAILREIAQQYSAKPETP